MDKPAPLAYRRFVNAYTVVLLPALTGAVSAWGLPDNTVKKVLIVLTLTVPVVKGLGMILGNGQIFSPSNQVIDSQKQ